MSSELLTLVFTYNEAECIEKLIEEYFSCLPEAALLIVDDSSPDKTAEIARNLKNRYSGLHILERTGKKGRGAAAVDGYRFALKNFDHKFIAHMDGDLSHHPLVLTGLMEALAKCDVAIASRFHLQGKDLRRDLIRRTVSILSNLWIRFIFNSRLHDNTSGFVAMKREALAAISPQLKASGPEIVEEMLYFFFKKRALICEVPYSFRERAGGETKLSLKKMLICFAATVRLRFLGSL